jgi:SAM-dependent methyltransferase
MADYDKSFATRGHQYMYAVETYPCAMEMEFQIAAEKVLATHPSSVLNIPAAGVPLNKYLPSTISYTAFETSPSFAEISGHTCASLFEIPLASESIDTIISLAALHHATAEERIRFFKETLRILKPGGSFIVGDVLKGSRMDSWLNDFVNRHNSAGHCGNFWTDTDCETFRTAGFQTAEFSKSEYTWNFDNSYSMFDFTRHLFGLDLVKSDHDVREGLVYYLDATETTIPWELGYFVCRKADN